MEGRHQECTGYSGIGLMPCFPAARLARSPSRLAADARSPSDSMALIADLRLLAAPQPFPLEGDGVRAMASVPLNRNMLGYSPLRPNPLHSYSQKLYIAMRCLTHGLRITIIGH